MADHDSCDSDVDGEKSVLDCICACSGKLADDYDRSAGSVQFPIRLYFCTGASAVSDPSFSREEGGNERGGLKGNYKILRLKKWLSVQFIKNTLMKEKPGFIFSDQSMGGIIYGSVIYFRS